MFEFQLRRIEDLGLIDDSENFVFCVKNLSKCVKNEKIVPN